jgi:hypothetical protein
MTTAIEEGEWSASRPGRSLPPGMIPVPIVQEAGWAPGPVWTGAENLALTGIRSPDRPAYGQSLYKLRYMAHILSVATDYSQTRLTLLYVFFCVIPRRLSFICRCFGTLCLFHVHG